MTQTTTTYTEIRQFFQSFLKNMFVVKILKMNSYKTVQENDPTLIHRSMAAMFAQMRLRLEWLKP